MIKNNFRILKKPHAYLQTILKALLKFQKDRTNTVGRVKGTRYLLKIRNHTPRTTESRKQCPSEKVIKNYFRILKNPHAHLQAILKTHVKFQKDRPKTEGGVKGTRYLLPTDFSNIRTQKMSKFKMCKK